MFLTPLSADFNNGIRIALHSRVISTVPWFLGLLIVAVLLASQFSARQPDTVALDVGLSVIRLVLPLFAILLAQELLSREFERRLYLTSFTYPRQRSHWLLGRIAAILLLCLGLLLALGLLLTALVNVAGGDYQQATPIALGLPYQITLSFVAVDLLVAVAVASLLAISASTPAFVLIGTIGFLLIARSYTPIIELLRSNPYAVSNFADPRLYQDSLGLLAFLLPDLGRLDVRMIALYDKMAFMPAEWPLLLLATLVYVAFLLGLSVWILNKREFN